MKIKNVLKKRVSRKVRVAGMTVSGTLVLVILALIFFHYVLYPSVETLVYVVLATGIVAAAAAIGLLYEIYVLLYRIHHRDK